MHLMFSNATSFNQDISNWDVSNVQFMQHMFLGALTFNQDLSGWDVSSVLDMEGMFVGANLFNADIGGWDVSSVSNMAQMFESHPIFNQDLSGWDVSQVANMNSMFHDAAAFNQSLGAWSLRPGVNLNNVLSGSGMDCETYSSTLLGWASNPLTPDDLIFGAEEIEYASEAVPSRNVLLAKGWTITDGGESNSCAFMIDPFISTWQTNNPGISASNQVTIPATGSGFMISWEEVNNSVNQGSLTGNGSTTITFPHAGIYRIRIVPGSGSFSGIVFHNGGDKLKLLTIDQWGTHLWTVAEHAFYGCENLTVNAVDIPLLDVTSMRNMFRGCGSIYVVPNMNAWDVSEVTNMSGLFADAGSFNQAIGLWDVGNVVTMDSMFYYAAVFNMNIGGWNVGSVTAMAHMFNGASSFNQDIGDWNTAEVADMQYMFYNAFAFSQDIGEWSLASLNTAMDPMEGMLSFSGMECIAYSFTLIGWEDNVLTPDDISLGAESLNFSPEAVPARNTLITTKNWTIVDAGTDTNCELYSNKFITVWKTNEPGESGNNQIRIPATGTNFLVYWEDVSDTSVNGTLTGNGTTTITFPASGTYRVKIQPGMGTFTRIAFAATGDRLKLKRIENWGTIPWSSFLNAFNGCENLTVTATDTAVMNAVTTMSGMFQNCRSLAMVPSLNTWNLGTVTNLSLLFYGATNFNQPIGAWNTSNVINMSNMFFQAVSFNQAIGNWNTSKVTNMSNMFNGASTFNQNIGTWNTGAVTNMSAMFQDATSFNQSLNSWNVSKVTNMSNVFYNAIAFNGNIGSWNTVLVTNMSSMFSFAAAFNQNIGSWNTGNVTNMFGTFNGAVSFNQNIGNWNTIKVTTMFVMFQNAIAFNQNIGSWNTANVTSMNSMFNGATAFNQNIGNWNVGKVTGMSGMFSGASAFNQDIDNWNVRKVTSMSAMFLNAVSFNHDLESWTFAPNVLLLNMLSNSGMDCDNYSETLTGWAANDTIPMNRNLGALDIYYLPGAADARDTLTLVYSWTITDGGEVDVCPFPADQVYVDMEATGLNDGTSWVNAFTDLQDAIEVVDNDLFVRTIWIADGTYYPTMTTDRHASFVLMDSVGIYGGFLGNELTLAQRTSDASLVHLSGNIGNVNDSTDNVYHVVTGNALCNDCLVDGLTIRYGRADLGMAEDAGGAGLYNEGTLLIDNCIIEHNTCTLQGAAIYNRGTEAGLSLRNCVFRLNTSAQERDIFNSNGGQVSFEGVNSIQH
jgi:surface protein